MEQITLFNEYSTLELYVYGIMLSISIKFIVLTIAGIVSKNTRLKEIKNICKKLSKLIVRYSYLSLVWPVEILVFAYKNIKYLAEK
tara:strand:+ start:123 stop:380 length:258 start_codon:yes stop_codon:yes gene_type:complete